MRTAFQREHEQYTSIFDGIRHLLLKSKNRIDFEKTADLAKKGDAKALELLPILASNLLSESLEEYQREKGPIL